MKMKNLNALGFTTLVSTKENEINSSDNFVDFFILITDFHLRVVMAKLNKYFHIFIEN